MGGNPKIIILRGNSGSGKSIVAAHLQRKLGRGTLVISQDVVRREMLWVKDGNETKALSLLINLIAYGKENCRFVILEGILNATWYRSLFERVLADYDSNIYAYYYDLPFEETLLRHQTKPNCNDFGQDEMRRWWNEKDFIGIIPEKTLTAELSIDNVLEMILKDVNS